MYHFPLPQRPNSWHARASSLLLFISHSSLFLSEPFQVANFFFLTINGMDNSALPFSGMLYTTKNENLSFPSLCLEQWLVQIAYELLTNDRVLSGERDLSLRKEPKLGYWPARETSNASSLKWKMSHFKNHIFKELLMRAKSNKYS